MNRNEIMKEKIKKNGLLHAFYSFFNTIIKGYKIYKNILGNPIKELAYGHKSTVFLLFKKNALKSVSTNSLLLSYDGFCSILILVPGNTNLCNILKKLYS